MSELYSNDPSTTLSGSMTTGASSLAVVSATGFPAGPNFRIRIDNELMLVTGVAGTTWTITRGIEGTTVTSHASGATVNHYLTAGALDQIRADMLMSGGISSLPTSGMRLGDVYFLTDSVYNFARYNGSAWEYFKDGFKCTPPPLAATLTTTMNTSGITLTDEADGLLVTCNGTGSGSENWGAYLKTYPGSSFTFDIGIQMLYLAPVPYSYYGILASNGTAGVVHGAALGSGVSYGTQFFNAKYNNTGSYNSNYGTLISTATPPVSADAFFLRWMDDLSSTRHMKTSADGLHWYDSFGAQGGVSRTDFLTPTTLGIVVGQSTNATSTSYPRIAFKIFHWTGF